MIEFDCNIELRKNGKGSPRKYTYYTTYIYILYLPMYMHTRCFNYHAYVPKTTDGYGDPLTESWQLNTANGEEERERERET